MKIIEGLQQGSDDWHHLRASHFCASEAAAMLGLDPRVSRSELIRMKATGDEREYSEWVQRNLLDKGHEIEGAAIEIAEEKIGEELYPLVAVGEIDV